MYMYVGLDEQSTVPASAISLLFIASTWGLFY